MIDFYFTATTMCPDCRAQEDVENLDIIATGTAQDIVPCAFCGKRARCSIVLLHGTEDIEDATQRMSAYSG